MNVQELISEAAAWVKPAVATVAATVAELGEAFRATALEMIAAPGGILLLVAGIIGMMILAYDAVALIAATARRLRARRTVAPTPAARARGLSKLGAKPAEIARAVGLPRDALALVVPEEFGRCTQGDQIPERAA